MQWTDIDGWCDFPEVYTAAVAALPENAVAVELGSWLGKSTALFASLLRDAGRTDVKFFSVDHGFGNADKSAGVCQPAIADAGCGNVAGRLAANLKACGVLEYVYPVTTTTVRAARLFPDESVDFCFVDANHTYESCLEDIRLWWPKIKPGGMLAGHDRDEHWPDVCRAVRDFFGHDGAHPLRSTCWGVVKPAANG